MSYHTPSSSAMRATAPFDSKDANLILRSSDGVDFRVHKPIIALASPVLDAFCSPAPQPPPPPASRRHRKRPVVELSEPSEVLDMFLRFIYPVPEPSITLDDVAILLELSRRYAASCVASRMRLHLLRPEHLESDSLRVYALASLADMDDVALIAARHTLAHSPPGPGQLAELRTLPGHALVRLMDYRKKCMQAAASVTDLDQRGSLAVPWWIQLQWRRFCFLSECGYGCAKMPRRRLRWHKTVSGCVDVPEWWVEYMDAVGMALRQRLDPGVARAQSLVRSAVEKAVGCSKCAGRVFWDMEDFAKILEAAVEEAISSVELDVSRTGEYEDNSRALVPCTKTNYLLPSDRVVWPLFDYFFNVYAKRLEQPDDEEDCEGDRYDLVSLAPSSDY
ncbi:hypothetical protein K466DRAFT_552303 [Polyporus arcularius HHB13444]|uniref:BTB domain-containing protein n=1 Tax=Polyporus arcularius HHB13444 TaxID=1314778 RepID=A0A5C3P6N9_9APHY|nr:hypothetical protein K466DRAFT_552303 [Polyporus arcularius HHB13444]